MDGVQPTSGDSQARHEVVQHGKGGSLPPQRGEECLNASVERNADDEGDIQPVDVFVPVGSGQWRLGDVRLGRIVASVPVWLRDLGHARGRHRRKLRRRCHGGLGMVKGCREEVRRGEERRGEEDEEGRKEKEKDVFNKRRGCGGAGDYSIEQSWKLLYGSIQNQFFTQYYCAFLSSDTPRHTTSSAAATGRDYFCISRAQWPRSISCWRRDECASSCVESSTSP